jgi:hypothetical protein
MLLCELLYVSSTLWGAVEHAAILGVLGEREFGVFQTKKFGYYGERGRRRLRRMRLTREVRSYILMKSC